MASLSWFRMWAEAVDDEKLRLLAFEDRWHFVALLCLKAQGILDEKNEELRWRKMGIKLGLDSVELETVMKRLETVGLVSCNAEKNFQPTNWNRRQFVSDSSTRRVRAFRKRQGNVSVTPSETESETEKIKRAQTASRASILEIPEPDEDPEQHLLYVAGPEYLGGKAHGLVTRLIGEHGRTLVADKLAELMNRPEQPRDPKAYFLGIMRKLERRFQP